MTADPVVTLDTTATREDGIGKMLETLRANMAKAPEGSLEARIAAILMDVLPGFYRALDRERIGFTKDLLAEQALGIPASEGAALDTMLMVMVMPMINMLSATVITLVPCIHKSNYCKRCQDLRGAIFANMLENLNQNVREALLRHSQFGAGDGHALHS